MTRPRVLWVSRTRYRLPLSPALERKWGALAAQLELRVLGASADGSHGDGTFVLVSPFPLARLTGAAFWCTLPFRVAALLRSFRPDAVVTQSPYEAAAVLVAARLTGSGPRIVTDVQGDWRTATRLYGSPLRGALSPVADALAAAVLRRVDAVRTISPYTSALVRAAGVEPAAEFPTFVDLDRFTEPEPAPAPDTPTALFVGVLEPYKNVDGLAAAWRLVASRLPGARLNVVGEGSRADVVRALVAEHPDSVRWTPRLDTAGVAAAMDDATLLVLPSRSEGMGRVVIEAFCRARPVVGTRVGGIADLVEHQVTGVLVEPGSAEALADELVGLLDDPQQARRLGDAARERVRPWLQTPEEFALRTRALIEGAG